jgi:hypothetical protein
MNKISRIALVSVGGFLSLTIIAGVAGSSKPAAAPQAKVEVRTNTVTVTSTPEPTSVPTLEPTAVPTATPTPRPTPTPRAAACPSGFHNGKPGDSYSGCFADPTPTPVPSTTCYRLMSGDDSDTGAHAIIEMKVTGPTAEIGCMAIDIQDGSKNGTVTFAVTPTAMLASDAHYNCTTTLSGNTVVVYDNGTAFSRAAAGGFCKG